jgi:hypothetical protein
VTFFLQILGRKNGRSVSSAAVVMADSVRVPELVSALNLYAIPDSYTMLTSESLLCGE